MDTTAGFNCSSTSSIMPQITSFQPIAMPQPVSHLASINQLCAADSLHMHVSAGEYIFDSPDHHVNILPEELAETSLRIQRAVRSLPSFHGDILSLSSRPVDELLETACCLVNLIDRYTMGRISMPSDTHHGGDDMRQHAHGTSVDSSPEMTYESPFLQPSSPIMHSHNQSAADTSMYLMILSSHQALLGAFEDIGSSLLQCIRELPQPAGSPATDFISSSTTQIVSHLLARLDVAVSSLAGSADLLHAVGHIEVPPATATTTTTASLLSPISSLSSSSSSTTSPDGFDNFYEARRIPAAGGYSHNHFQPRDERADAGHHHRQLSAFLVFEQMEQRQLRVQEQVEMLKELIRWSSAI
ncbi:hypothetical protein B0T22DRAFT_451818 [Podospora appendiculata]|uniref:Aflatoxin regulatory protein domain-containing protein n=1 Tax=Podospora appendiculata TaxID=314037 RepID=A0AAE0XIR7_9PEZI|nr:hypothetical protein B0T22DRAFT_451818 [Podospora appendiculata]